MRCENAGRRAAAGIVLALFVSVLAALAPAACGGGEEEEATATAIPTATPTATATPRPSPPQTASPTPQASPTQQPALAPWPTPTMVAPTPARPTPAPPTAPAPPLPPSWQTSAPREPLPAGEVVELGIRNENGTPAETYAIGVQVNLPDGSPVNMEGEVVGAEWTYFSVSQTSIPGTYTVYFGLPQSDLIYAQDSFEVYAPAPPPGEDFTTLTWQTSAPRTPVGIGEVVELGLRNKYGEPGECYDFVIELLDPLGDYAWAEDIVCADEWTDFIYEDTFLSGTYDVYFSIEGQVIAQDSFEVIGD
jgi:hypothetical protein